MADVALSKLHQSAIQRSSEERDGANAQLRAIDQNIAVLQKERAKQQAILDNAQAQLSSFITEIGGDPAIHVATRKDDGCYYLCDVVAKAEAEKAAAKSS